MLHALIVHTPILLIPKKPGTSLPSHAKVSSSTVVEITPTPLNETAGIINIDEDSPVKGNNFNSP